MKIVKIICIVIIIAVMAMVGYTGYQHFMHIKRIEEKEKFEPQRKEPREMGFEGEHQREEENNSGSRYKTVDGVEILEEDKDKMIIRAEVKAGTKKQRTIKITASAGTKYEKYDTNTVVDFGDRKRKSSFKR